MKTVGAYEARTHLSKLLNEVSRGERITITRHGVPVAILAPCEEGKQIDYEKVWEEFSKLRKGRTLGDLTIREMIDEGRRF